MEIKAVEPQFPPKKIREQVLRIVRDAGGEMSVRALHAQICKESDQMVSPQQVTGVVNALIIDGDLAPVSEKQGYCGPDGGQIKLGDGIPHENGAPVMLLSNLEPSPNSSLEALKALLSHGFVDVVPMKGKDVPKFGADALGLNAGTYTAPRLKKLMDGKDDSLLN